MWCVVTTAACAPAPAPPTGTTTSATPVVSSSASAMVASSPRPPRIAWLNPRDGANGTVTATASGGGVSYAFGDDGLVWRRRGNEAWRTVDSDLVLSVASAAVLGSGHVVVVAGPDDARVLLRSEDEGRTFVQVARSRRNDPLARVVERDPDLVVATARGVVLVSSDEGTTLAPYAELATATRALHVDASGAVYLGGEHGRLFVSRTRRAPWDKLETGTTESIDAIWSFGDEVLIGGGHYEGAGASSGFVRVSRDAGKSFRPVPGVTGEVSSLLGVGKATFAIAQGTLLRRDDGPFVRVAANRDVWPVQVLVGDAAAFTAFGNHGARLVSLDGGKSFASRDVGFDDDLTGVVALDERRIVAVGLATLSGKDRLPGSQEYRGVVVRSEDGGVTWTRSVIDAVTSLSAVCASGDRIYALGFMGALQVSDDAGKTFRAAPSPGDFDTCATVGARTVVFAGKSGSIARSIDGGASFQASTLPSPIDVRGLDGGGAEKIVARGDAVAFASDDGGASWTPVADGSSVPTLALSGGVGVRLVEGTIRWSSNGSDWVRKPIGAPRLAAMARMPVAEGATASVVVVGEAGAIVRLLPPEGSPR